MQMNIVEQARMFAIGAHQAVGQKRKYIGIDYWHHPEDVVDIATNMLQNVNIDDYTKEEIIAACWLHDVVEDTGVTVENIVHTFGRNVALLVDGCTKLSTVKDTHKMLSFVNNPVAFIKLCDAVANLVDVQNELEDQEDEAIIAFATKFQKKKLDMHNHIFKHYTRKCDLITEVNEEFLYNLNKLEDTISGMKM